MIISFKIKLNILILGVLLCALNIHNLYGQEIKADSINVIYNQVDKRYILNDLKIQFEITDDINNMYNYNFQEARVGFLYLGRRFPKHPISDFLMSISYYWEIRTDASNDILDDKIFDTANDAIDKGKELLDNEEDNAEILFLVSASYSLKARVHGERSNWTRAIYASKQSLHYFELASQIKHFLPEIDFGQGLYDYYSVWLAEHYRMLRPILSFFPDGDKKKGIEKLKEASLNAFYTRVEAQYFLIKILIGSDEKQYDQALSYATRLYHTYPENPLFHRAYVQSLYFAGQYKETEKEALIILEFINKNKKGYEANSGRYASFFLGQFNHNIGQYDKASTYYNKAIEYSEMNDHTKSGYCLYSYIGLGDLEKLRGKNSEAKKYYKKAKRLAKRSNPAFKAAKKRLSGSALF